MRPCSASTWVRCLPARGESIPHLRPDSKQTKEAARQVRDQIHARDLVRAIDQFVRAPRPGEIYNMGGGRHSNISVLEAVKLIGVEYQYIDAPRKGDHIWYISDVSKFKKDYPRWQYEYDINAIVEDLVG